MREEDSDMARLLGVPVMLLVLSSPAWAGNPVFDLPAQGENPVQSPQRDSITPNVGGVPDIADLSPGDHAPDFKLRNSSGTLVQLADLKGHLSVLIFQEDCKLLGPYRDENDSLAALGVREFGICQNSTHAVESYAARARLGFPLLSDPDANVSQRFGMYDTENQAIEPGLILLDEKGIILMIVRGHGMHPEALPELVRHAMAAHLAESVGS
jgi:peroxiredoxin Q/BCP